MNILYFHQHFSTPKGSTGTRSYEMSRALLQAGHEVTMVCGSYDGGVSGLAGSFRGGKREGKVDGIRVIEFEIAYSNYDSFVKRTLTFLKYSYRSIGIAMRENYDLIFATSTPLTASIPGIIARWIRRKRFVFEVRDLWPDLPREMGVITNPIILWLMSLLELVSYRSAHACIGLSPGIVEGIKSRANKQQQVAMIPNGCDITLFTTSVQSKTRPSQLAENELMAVFTGAHGIANGLYAVIDAAQVLKDRGRNDIKFVFIGDGKLKPELCEQVLIRGLTNCIFLDPMPKESLVSYLKGADIGLMILADVPAFYYGTSPNKFFDYLSIGLPVLNNYPGWIADMINENDCGYTVAPGDPEAFANALEDAAESPEKLHEKGLRAQNLGHERFDRRKLSNEFVNWLECAQSGSFT